LTKRAIYIKLSREKIALLPVRRSEFRPYENQELFP